MTVLDPVSYDEETLVRQFGVIARDQYEQHGLAGPFQIADERTTVRWDPVNACAVFYLDGVTTTVPEAALDTVGLVVADAIEDDASRTEGC